MRKEYKIKIIIVIVIIVIAGFLFSCRSESEVIMEDATSVNISLQNTTDQSEDMVYIYITGAVKKPDVYKVHSECRVYDIINLAGGFLDDADRKNINLADKVYDGMKIIVYSIYENAAEDSSYESGNRLVNINTASRDELMTLPGIGQSKADSIIKYREENGRFTAIEEMMNISGIKEGAFGKIKELITI